MKTLASIAAVSLMSSACFAPSDTGGSAGSSANGSAKSQEITIQGHDFTVPAPYAEGHTLNANEASALNQLLAENIRNNAASRIKAAAKDLETDVEKLDLDNTMVGEGDSQMSLRAAINAYAADYKFGERKTRTAAEPVDPTEREAFRIAKDSVTEAVKAQGLKIKDLAEGQFDALVKQLSETADVLAEAKRRVKAKEKLGASALGITIPGGSTPDQPAAGTEAQPTA